MANPLKSETFSKVTIKTSGLGLAVIDEQDLTFTAFGVDLRIPCIFMNALVKSTDIEADKIIVDNLEVKNFKTDDVFIDNSLTIGNPTTIITTALAHIYVDDVGLESQFVIEQDGVGNVGMEFLLTDDSSYMIGIDNNALGNPFKIAFSGTTSALLGTNDILNIQPTTTGNIGIGFDTLTGITTGSNNIALGSRSGFLLDTTDSNNILIGNSGTLGDNGEIRIGTSGTHNCVSFPGSVALSDEQYETPGNGGSVTILNRTSIVIIDPTGSLTNLTVNMPLSPKDGQILYINITQNITNFIHNGNGNIIIESFASTVTANASGTWYFRSTDTTWYPISIPVDSSIAGAGNVIGPGSATNNAIARFDGTTGEIIQNSSVLIDDLGNISLNPHNTNTGEIRFLELFANGTNYTAFKAPDSITSNIIYTLPDADGLAGQILQTDGSGILSWVSASGAVSGPPTSTINGLARWNNITGTLLQDTTNIRLDDNGFFLFLEPTNGNKGFELPNLLTDAFHIRDASANKIITINTTNLSIELPQGRLEFLDSGSGDNKIVVPNLLANAINIQNVSGTEIMNINTINESIELTAGRLDFTNTNNEIVIQSSLEFKDNINNFITLDTTTTEVKLQQNSVFGKGINYNVTTITLNTLLDDTHFLVRCDTSSGNIELTLPLVSIEPGRQYKIIKVDNSNILTISPSGADLINGVASVISLNNQYSHITLISDGVVGWFSM